jgi:hypothetical protein
VGAGQNETQALLFHRNRKFMAEKIKIEANADPSKTATHGGEHGKK